jgi:peptide/nickel transport system substrate-binding protein
MRKVLFMGFLFCFLFSFAVFCGGEVNAASEAPMLAEMVKAGTLPPLEERLPEDVQVVKPVEKVGKYGGTLRSVDINGVDIAGLVKHGLFALAQDFSAGSHDWYKGIAESKIVPNIAKDGVFSEDKKTFTLYLRKGMRWSDGEPVTADDFMFWWEDIVNNKEITPEVPTIYKPDGEPMQVKKIDDYTIEFTFGVPYKFFKFYLCDTAVRQMPLRPKHYFQQFHIKYNPDADKLAKEAGFDNWWELLDAKAGSTEPDLTAWLQNTELPTLYPYKTVEYKAGERWVGERNPYYFKVDTEGNQLPYIDKIVCELSSNREVLTAKVVAGQVDYSAVALPFRDIPLLKENEAKGDFTTALWDTPMGAMPSILINQTYQKDQVLREIFRDVRFRKAMSLAINREEANKVAYFGLSYPTQATVLPGSRFYEEKYANASAEYDPDAANSLLDEMGLKWDENHEYRLRSDGETLTVVLEDCDVGAIRGYSKIRPLLEEYWKAIGVKIVLKQHEPGIWWEKLNANEIQLTMWGIDSFNDYSIQIMGPWIIPGTSYGGFTWHAVLWQQWVLSDGKEGEEPPEEVKTMRDLWLKLRASTDEEEITQLGKEIFQIQADNLFVLGVVGNIKQPAVVKNNLKNFPKEAVWSNVTSLAEYGWAFQWFFE